jgi:F0F1-type ATP synthase assembly protein I
MKEQGPLSLAQLAGAGTGLIGPIFIGLLLGYVVARYAPWEWGLPVGIVAGFVAGMISMYRRISSLM